MTERTLTMVVGYIPRVDELPREARDLGFLRRVALALDTCRSNNVDLYFDVDLYTAMLDVIGQALASNQMSLRLRSRETAEAAGALDVKRRLEGVPVLEREPIPTILLKRGDLAVGLVESVLWANVGGPQPYHDSYTMAVYSSEDVAARLESMVRSRCEREGAELTEVVRASPTPQPRGIMSRILAHFWLTI
jgi:hypothetical protein